MTDTQKSHVLHALKVISEAIEKDQVEEFQVVWEDETLFESLKYAPVPEWPIK